MRDKRRVASAELFPTDRPLSAEAMIGREEDVDRVATALLGGVNTVLAGPRRTGKTTVADAAVAICAQEGAYIASVDLFQALDVASFAHQLTLELLANRAPLRRAITDAARAGRSILEALRTTATYRVREDLGQDIELTLELTLAERDPQGALLTALGLPQRLADSDGRRVILFLDEFQDIASRRFGDPETITRRIRGILQRSTGVSVLFAGSIEHLMRDLFAPGDRALSQFGSFHELAPITIEQWTTGLRRRLRLDDTTITDDALEHLLEFGEGHPRATMLLAQQAHLMCIEELSREIDNALVIQALDRALGAERLRHEQQIERIRATGRHGERMAIRVAAGSQLYADLQPEQASRALSSLRDIGVIDRGEKQGQWFLTDPLLRRYLARRRVESLSFGRSATDTLGPYG
jgi:DNA-binding transcriptional ArsR family regulator